jgi:hypothetical protein
MKFDESSNSLLDDSQNGLFVNSNKTTQDTITTIKTTTTTTLTRVQTIKTTEIMRQTNSESPNILSKLIYNNNEVSSPDPSLTNLNKMSKIKRRTSEPTGIHNYQIISNENDPISPIITTPTVRALTKEILKKTNDKNSNSPLTSRFILCQKEVERQHPSPIKYLDEKVRSKCDQILERSNESK